MRTLVLMVLTAMLACGRKDDTARTASTDAAGTGTGVSAGTGAGTGAPGTGTGLPATGSGSGSASGAGTGATATGTGGATTTGTYDILYAAWPGVGIDRRVGVTATFRGDGLLGYVHSAQEAPTIGSTSARDTRRMGASTLGRWSGGWVEGSFYGNTPIRYAEDEGFHWVLTDTPVHTGPLGIEGAYKVAAATSPTGLDGSGVGTLDALEIRVAPGDPPLLGVDLAVTVGGEPYAFRSAGWPAATVTPNAYNGLVSLFGTPTAEGSLCGFACSVSVYLTFTDDHDGMVLAWQFSGTDRVSGVAILQSAP